MNPLVRPWRLYASFKGRSRRTEFLLFFISWYGAIFIAAFVGGIVEAFGFEGGASDGPGIPGWGAILALIAGVVPAFAVTIRRLHDQDKPGWFLLITLIPVIGGLFWFLIAFWPGTKGENDYGWDPREGENPHRDLEQIFS